MAVGSYNPNNVKAELFDFEMRSWKVVSDYPYSSGYSVSWFTMLYVNELSSFIVIGGNNYDGDQLATIGKFRNGFWFVAGRMNEARFVS